VHGRKIGAAEFTLPVDFGGRLGAPAGEIAVKFCDERSTTARLQIVIAGVFRRMTAR
jgi:hypothetical protein